MAHHREHAVYAAVVPISYPEDDYLNLVGRLAYAVTFLEGLVLYDLPRLKDHLPSKLTLKELAGGTTGGIGKLITDHAQKATHPAVATWLKVAGQLLCRAAKIRNPVLHARPATIDNQQQLFRWGTREQFPITIDRLREGIAEIEEMVLELGNQRLPLRLFPPA